MAALTFSRTLPYALALLLIIGVGRAVAQDAAQAGADSAAVSQLGSWLQPAGTQTAPGESFRATTGTVAADPFAVLTSGALWQETYGEIYTRDLGNAFSLTDEVDDVVFDEDAEAMARQEKLGLLFAPVPEFSFNADFHDATFDSLQPNDGTTTAGGGFSAKGRLPTQSIVTVGLNFDHTVADAPDALATETRTYEVHLEQPVGKLPLSAVLKGGFSGTEGGGAASSLPSIEQSLIWKPLANTTVQMGLRQQQYQEYPGVNDALNEAIFADLSQRVLDNVSWHSYAEILNTKGLVDQAPASPIASGANGTPQATGPNSNAGLTSSVPVSVQNQTVTFSTGPSVQLQKDVSASVQYSNRWDTNPAAGSTGQEQRVSVSVKGTF